MNEKAVRIAFCAALYGYLCATQTPYETQIDQIKFASQGRWKNMHVEAREMLPRGTRYDDMWAPINALFDMRDVREVFPAELSVKQIQLWAWIVLDQAKPDELAQLSAPFDKLPT